MPDPSESPKPQMGNIIYLLRIQAIEMIRPSFKSLSPPNPDLVLQASSRVVVRLRLGGLAIAGNLIERPRASRGLPGIRQQGARSNPDSSTIPKAWLGDARGIASYHPCARFTGKGIPSYRADLTWARFRIAQLYDEACAGRNGIAGNPIPRFDDSLRLLAPRDPRRSGGDRALSQLCSLEVARRLSGALPAPQARWRGPLRCGAPGAR